MTKPPKTGGLRKLLEAEPISVLGRLAGELGVEVHLVGGAVRDCLLGRESHDFDVVVSGRGRELAEGVAREAGARFVPLGGKEFASFRVVAARGEGETEAAWELDVWDREGGPLEADLARRDFTVNAIAVAVAVAGAEGSRTDPSRRPEAGGPLAARAGGTGDAGAERGPILVDPFGGVADLERRCLRATTPETFSGDPLRVLRLPRFLVQLDGFAADPGTVALARRAVPGLARVAAERVRDELELIFRRERAERGVAAMLEVGVYPSLWLGDPGQPAGGEMARRAAAAPAALGRLGERAAEVARLAPGAPPVDLPAARWALAFAVLAPPGPDGPSGAPTALVDALRERGFLTRDLAARVTRLVAETEVPPDERGRRRFLHWLGPAWPTAVACLGARLPETGAPSEDRLAGPPGAAAVSRGATRHATGPPPLTAWRRAVQDLAALLAGDGERILAPPRLLSGEEVQALLGLSPGPEIGRVLAMVRQAQVDGEIATREEAEALLLGGD